MNNSFIQKNLSVLVLCFNQWDLIDDLVNTFLVETNPEYLPLIEFLICDDCSLYDRRMEFVTKYSLKPFRRFCVFRNFENLGPGQSRNRLLSIQNSSHFCFVDGDDHINSLAINEFFECVSFCDIYQFPFLISGKIFKPRFSFRNAFNSISLYFSPHTYSRRNVQYFLFPSCSRIISSEFSSSYNYRYSKVRLFEDILPYAIATLKCSTFELMRNPIVFVEFSLESRSRCISRKHYIFLFQSLRDLWRNAFEPANLLFVLNISICSIVSVIISHLRYNIYSTFRKKLMQ